MDALALVDDLRDGEIRSDWVDVEIWEILAQGVGLRRQKVSGNIHRNVGADRASIQ